MFEIHHHYRSDPAVAETLQQILTTLNQLKEMISKMSPELQALSDQVAQNEKIEESAVTLIKGLADQITAAKDDPAAIVALAEGLKGSASDLGAAITANTTPPAPVATPPAPAA